MRGLISMTVAASENTVRRRYPGVLEPVDITTLSFEVAGRIGRVDLAVGQRVSAGDVLARLDSEQFEIEIENRRAVVAEAAATLEQDVSNLERAEELLSRGVGTQVARDQAATNRRTSEARLRQAQEALAAAEDNLANAILLAPFDGVVNSVDVDSFATVGAGASVASLYATDAYEVSFSVNFDTLADLVVGTPADVRLADDPATTLAAVVSELGERADTVSSFPVIVGLRETHPILKSGMAVEVAFELELPAERGFLLPISAAITDGEIPESAGPRRPTELPVFVYDPDAGVVRRRIVTMAGIRENQLLIVEGLAPGDRVATAGVAFLRDGMRVTPIDRADRFGN